MFSRLPGCGFGWSGVVLTLVALVGSIQAAADEKPEPVELTPPDGVRLVRATFTPDGTGVVAVGWDAKSPTVLYAWDLKSKQRTRIGTRPDEAVELHGLDWSPDGRAVILIWAKDQFERAEWVDAKTGTLLATLDLGEYTLYAGGKPAKAVKWPDGPDGGRSGLSPGGREIVGLSFRPPDRTELVRLNFRAGKETRRAKVADEELPVSEYSPGFSLRRHSCRLR